MALGQCVCCGVFDTRAHVSYCMETMVSIALYKRTCIHMDTVQTATVHCTDNNRTDTRVSMVQYSNVAMCMRHHDQWVHFTLS